MRLTIDRSKWLRGGQGPLVSLLYHPRNAKRCCIGHLCSALGVSDEDLENRAYPKNLALSIRKRLPDWLDPRIENGRADVYSATEVNDDNDLSPEERERRITEIFARNGVNVEFVG